MPFDPQIYRLASIARDKLCREAARASHDLRVLVAHANILDELLIELNTPKYEAPEHCTFDLVPRSTTAPTVHRGVVVTVKDSFEHQVDDDGAFETPRHLTLDTSPSSLPILSHDSSESESESESDSSDSSDSDADSDDDEFETVITPTSPTDDSNSAVSSADEDDVEPDEGDLALHRTKSGWSLFGSKTTISENRQKRKDVNAVGNPIDAVTHEVQLLRLSTA